MPSSATFTRSAELSWEGDVVRGTGTVRAGTGAFTAGAKFPTLRGEPSGTTTPEELLAASHAVCFGIGLRSVIARHGGSAAKIVVTATVTAEKGAGSIRLRASHLEAAVSGLEGLDPVTLGILGTEAERECTISTAIRGSIAITHRITTA
jgi:lipoyl-dependent peroxiredoxin